MHRRLWVASLIGAALMFSSCGGGTTSPTSAAGPPVLFSVTGTASTAYIAYTLPDYSINVDPSDKLPFTFTWNVPPNRFQLVLLDVRITNPDEKGSVTVVVQENGIETGRATAVGFPNEAIVSYSHQ